MNKPDAILCSDIHLRDDVPIARTDDFFKALSKKIKFISDLQAEYDCPILCGGDVFHRAKSSPFLERWAIKNLPRMTTILGQHDLPNHSIKLFDKSSLSVLDAANTIEVISVEYHSVGEHKIKNKNIGMVHTFILKPKDKQDKMIDGSSGLSLLKKYKNYDIILSGDNHKSFTVERNGRLLVNPGSMMRTTAGQIEHKPRVYLWFEDSNTVEPVYLPIEDNVINREHIDVKEKRDRRIEAFVNRLDQNYELGMSFEKNMDGVLSKNKIRNGIKEMIMEAME